MGEVTGFESARGAMVADLRSAGIADPRVLAAMAEVPRERFVEPGDTPYAYDDGPLPIAAGQTISQPYIVALMIEAAGIGPDARVLEVGAGSGYAAAVIGRLAREVIALERHRTLADQAAARIAALGYGNVRILHADGATGWPAEAPYDAILAAAAPERVPEALKAQLAEGGRLVLPVGGEHQVQRLLRLTRTGGGFEQHDLGPVRFVPLVG
jgi:protein-L-isoaspartate(D-aspartate) O-methyltransferase